jgi:hypothetical protein
MNENLLSTLADLSARKLGSEEGNKILAPFMKQTMTLRATFVSNERTFTSRYEKSYVDGQTIVALLGEMKLEVAILIHPDSNWKEDHKPILPLSTDATFEIEVEVLGYNSLHQRVTFGEFIPDEMKSQQNKGVYGSKTDGTAEIPSVPVERSRRRRKSGDKGDEEERERKKFVFDDGKSENLGRGCMPLVMPEGNYLKWLLILFFFSIIAFLIGICVSLLSNL